MIVSSFPFCFYQYCSSFQSPKEPGGCGHAGNTFGRESLYKALSPEGNPEFSTVLKVVRALGLRLQAVTA